MKLELLEWLEAIEFWEPLTKYTENNDSEPYNQRKIVLRSHPDNEGLDLQLVDLQSILVSVKPCQFIPPDKLALRMLNRS